MYEAAPTASASIHGSNSFSRLWSIRSLGIPKRVAAASSSSSPLRDASDDAVVMLPHICRPSSSPVMASISSMQSYISCTISISPGFVLALVSRQAARDEACEAMSLPSSRSIEPALRFASWYAVAQPNRPPPTITIS